MTAFRIAGFSGLVPRLAKQLLAPNQAQVATNCRLTSGDIRPRNGLLPVYIPIIEGDIASMFRMEKEGNEKWLAWDRDVDVARSPVADNVSRRFYYTGDGEPRVSDYDMATAGAGPYPSGCYVLGVTPPLTAPTVLPVAGSGAGGIVASRSYVYTFVTPWGEESRPSPPSSAVSGSSDDAWMLSAMDGAPPNSGVLTNAVGGTPLPGQVEIALDTVFGLRAGEGIQFASVVGMTDLNGRFRIASVDTAAKKIAVALATSQAYSGGGTWARVAPHNTSGMSRRIYRTVTASSDTEYHYVATIPAVVSTFNDTVPDGEVALAEALPSAAWEMPPADMKGIIILANGIAAGFAGNEVLFSEPFKPYAWPVAYRQTYDQDIVAIAANGTTLVGMTTGNPFTITGVEPATMGGGMEKLGVAWPCMAKRGVANFAFGVGYPAPQGMVIIGTAAGTSDIVTKDLFTQSEWSELNPGTFIAAAADNRYYAGYSADGASLMFVIDKAESASFLKVNQRITAIWADPATGRLYVAVDRKIYEWEGDAGTKLTYEWRSRKFITAPPVNYGAARIDADFEMSEAEMAFALDAHEAAVAANHALAASGAMNDGVADPAVGEYEIGGDAMSPIPPLQLDSLQFQLWIDGTLKFSKQVGSSRAFRLPGGYKADNVEIVLSGNVKVSAVTLAETMDGLRQA
ncbi:MAG TPA: hypothetical protein VHB01_09280 [Nitrosospira sp.]|nr:hypothetical protein [Nitrosospira sp.]